jgi:hypothetical protein
MRMRRVTTSSPAEAARVLRYARFSRLRRLAQAEGIPVKEVMTGRVVPDGFSSILNRSGLIQPEPVDFGNPAREIAVSWAPVGTISV